MSVSMVKRNKRTPNSPKCCHQALCITWFFLFIKCFLCIIFLVWWSTSPHRFFDFSSVPMKYKSICILNLRAVIRSLDASISVWILRGFASFSFYEMILITYNFFYICWFLPLFLLEFTLPILNSYTFLSTLNLHTHIHTSVLSEHCYILLIQIQRSIYIDNIFLEPKWWLIMFVSWCTEFNAVRHCEM